MGRMTVVKGIQAGPRVCYRLRQATISALHLRALARRFWQRCACAGYPEHRELGMRLTGMPLHWWRQTPRSVKPEVVSASFSRPLHLDCHTGVLCFAMAGGETPCQEG